jgi:undecaprenyl-diphosphatase
MVIEALVLGAGVVVGAATYLAARWWPQGIEAPVVRPATIEHEVEGHPGLAGALARRINPAEVTGVALTGAVTVIAAGVVGIGLLLAMVHTDTGLARLDSTFARFGAERATEASTDFLRATSLLGGTTGVVLIAVLAGTVELRRTRTWAVAGFLALAVGGQFVLSNLIKLFVGRARPDILPLTGFSGESFPSGHATAAAATFMALALLLGRHRSTTMKAVLAAAAAGVAGAVAASRVLLGVHWFTDVLAGLLLGWLWFSVCSIVFGGRLLHFGAPVEQAEAVAEREADRQSIP